MQLAPILALLALLLQPTSASSLDSGLKNVSRTCVPEGATCNLGALSNECCCPFDCIGGENAPTGTCVNPEPQVCAEDEAQKALGGCKEEDCACSKKK
ncbi:hypothetical protein FB45DRAFT_951764 [Roridomyces roridus]|uniref:Uncharacterized protein n=1 Tax=Roridomyces roridus TaxID=1738132 RepID=A0AAD7AZX2_9AGAR|nr:hypothetical protein FB45DRAFT_951764 [Roridomyces roridus]